MGYVGNEPSVNFTSFAKQDITGNGGANYTLTHAVANANEIEVYVNNVRQEPTSAYSATGTALTMTGNVASSDDFYVIFLGKALQTTVPPDNSVTSAKISNGSIVNADINASAAISGSKLGTGAVLQVVQNTSTSPHSNTATSFTSTGFAVTITPTSSSSKVLLNVNATISASAINVQPIVTIYRGSTNIGDSTRGFGQTFNGAGSSHMPFSTTFLDSPNTTSATTYTVFMRTNSGTYIWGADSGTQTFIAQEIGG